MNLYHLTLHYCFGVFFFITCSFAGIIRSNEADGRIIGGEIIITATPYLVSITQDGVHICGGFIFNSKFVITAASCVHNIPSSSIKVVINQVSLISQDPEEKEIPVFKVTIKEDFDNKTLLNDIAIIQLSSELTLIPYEVVTTTTPGPSCIRYDELLPSQQNDESTTFQGWGATEVNGLGAQKLRKSAVSVSPNSNCNDTYGSNEYQASTMLCVSNVPDATGSATSGPCRYDEGGPLIVGDTKVKDIVVIGIYSKNKECDVSLPSIFTRLSAYYAWINTVAGAQPNNCYFASPTDGSDGLQ